MPSDTTVRVSHEGERSDATGGVAEPAVSVRPVERVDGDDTIGSGEPPVSAQAELARLHRLVLETRVAALEEQLEHKERQLDVIRRQYEQVVDQRGREGREEGGDGRRLLPWSLWR